jgi:hypothetical protein
LGRDIRKKTDDGSLANGRELSVLTESLEEIGHGKETTDLTTLVAEHESTDTGSGSKNHSDSWDFALRLNRRILPGGGHSPGGSTGGGSGRRGSLLLHLLG